MRGLAKLLQQYVMSNKTLSSATGSGTGVLWYYARNRAKKSCI
jgi:hypothetical protein